MVLNTREVGRVTKYTPGAYFSVAFWERKGKDIKREGTPPWRTLVLTSSATRLKRKGVKTRLPHSSTGTQPPTQTHKRESTGITNKVGEIVLKECSFTHRQLQQRVWGNHGFLHSIFLFFRFFGFSSSSPHFFSAHDSEELPVGGFYIG